MRHARRRRLPAVLARAALAFAVVTLSTVAIANQDVADLTGGEVDEVARWRAHLVASAFLPQPSGSLDSFDPFFPSLGTAPDRPFVLRQDVDPPADRGPDRRLAHDPGPRLDTLTGLGAYAEPSPEVTGAGGTAAVAPIQATPDGATPHTVLAAATTPVMKAPVEIAALPVVAPMLELPDNLRLGRGGEVSAKASAAQRKCLAEAIYFEARGEPERGQYAVAQVVMNRVRSVHYPDTICGVVYENKHWRNRCQFSFACDGIPDRVTDRESWAKAERIAAAILDDGYYLAEVGTATHYHADYVRPDWIRDMVKEERLGRHIFYRVRNWSEEGV